MKISIFPVLVTSLALLIAFLLVVQLHRKSEPLADEAMSSVRLPTDLAKELRSKDIVAPTVSVTLSKAGDSRELELWRAAFDSQAVVPIVALNLRPPSMLSSLKNGGTSIKVFWPMHWNHLGPFLQSAFKNKGMVDFYDCATQVAKMLSFVDKSAYVLDVGASFGYVGLVAASFGHPVIAFEPTPESYLCTLRGMLSNGFFSHMEVLEAAVGREKGTLSFFIPDGRSDNAALGRLSSVKNVGGKEPLPESVQVVAIDDILRERGILWNQVGAIKIDVQGYELDVVHGAAALLREAKPGMLVFLEVDEGLAVAAGKSIWSVYEFMYDFSFRPFVDAGRTQPLTRDLYTSVADAYWYKL